MSGASRQLTLARPAKGWWGGVLRSQPGADHLLLAGSGPLVLKVGGSLLSRPDWPALLASLIAARGPSSCCLVVGGGAVVDGLRSLDNTLPQPPQLMHDLAIDAMRLTARLVAAAVNVPIAASPPDDGGAAVLDVPAWLGIGSRATILPVGWQVTSDAIAATVAVEHGGHLLLAKSVPPPPCPDNGDLLLAVARAGWVDEHFPVAAGSLITIEWAAPDLS